MIKMTVNNWLECGLDVGKVHDHSGLAVDLTTDMNSHSIRVAV